MSPSRPLRPTDPAQLAAYVAALEAELQAKDLMIEKLKLQLATLRRACFGASSEKLERDIEQLELTLGELEENQAARQARVPAPPELTRRAPVRRQLPARLLREVIRHEPPAACPECGGASASRLGEDERELLEYVPAHFKVVVHVRPKLSCRTCETIRQAPMPSLPIERGRPGPGLIAHVLVSKYCDHRVSWNTPTKGGVEAA
ncbi:MAG: transposase [Caulobacteraceae bacterium]|nr:transposase [Caulobacteraceae bacterium]